MSPPEAEVADLYRVPRRLRGVLPEQHVVGVEVAVHDAFGVQVRQGAGDAQGQGHDCSLRGGGRTHWRAREGKAGVTLGKSVQGDHRRPARSSTCPHLRSGAPSQAEPRHISPDRNIACKSSPAPPRPERATALGARTGCPAAPRPQTPG